MAALFLVACSHAGPSGPLQAGTYLAPWPNRHGEAVSLACGWTSKTSYVCYPGHKRADDPHWIDEDMPAYTWHKLPDGGIEEYWTPEPFNAAPISGHRLRLLDGGVDDSAVTQPEHPKPPPAFERLPGLS